MESTWPERTFDLDETDKRVKPLLRVIYPSLTSARMFSSRKVLLGTHLSLCVEHYEAIMLLLHAQLVGSALAMVRPLLEGCVRGLWLYHIATDEQSRRILDENVRPPGLRTMLGDLDKARNAGRMFASIGKHWDTFCGLTHSGSEQIDRRIRGTGKIEPKYDPAEVRRCVDYTTALLILIVLDFLQATGRPEEYKNVAEAHEKLFLNDISSVSS